MADNEQDNDEYKFAELDSMDNESLDNADTNVNKDYVSSDAAASGKKDIKRNAIIAIALVFLAMILYKLIGSMFFSGKTESVTPIQNIPPVTQVTPQPVQTITPTPVPVQQVQPVTINDSDLQKKVAAIELSQQSVRAELSSMNDQVTTISNNINNLNTQVTNLNQVISNLANQVAKQSEEISVLMTRSRPKQIKPVTHRVVLRRITYYIQAVIPGRAWLIGSNGSTITVREGTKVAGYGTVKLIDSMQGRILTSSGQVIRFSQEDS